MQSGEVSLTHRVYSEWNGDVSLLYGVKSIWIDEFLSYTAKGDMPMLHKVAQETSIDNWLIGPQIGTLIEAPFPGGQLELTFKFAVTNRSVNKVATWDTGTGGPDVGKAEVNGAALVSDIGINGTFFITRDLHLRMGYHVLSITDVALATDNFETNVAMLGAGATDVRSDNGLVYQSVYIGMTFMH